MTEFLKKMFNPRSYKLSPAENVMNMPFTENPDMDIEKYAENFWFFTRGSGREVKNMMYKNLGSMEMRILDYNFTTGSGDTTVRHKETVFLLNSNNIILPKFRLHPRDNANSHFLMLFDENWGNITGQIQKSNLFSDLIKKIGRIWLKKKSIIERRGILFELCPFLCRNYRISGQNEVAIRALLNESVILYFELANKLNQDVRIHLEGYNDTLIYYRHELVLPDQDHLRVFIGEGLCVYALLQSSTKLSLDVLKITADTETCFGCGSSDVYIVYAEDYGQHVERCITCKMYIQPVRRKVWKMYMQNVSDKAFGCSNNSVGDLI